MSEVYHNNQDNTPFTRICLSCGKEKELEKCFDKQKSGKYGRRAHCKECRSKQQKEKPPKTEWEIVTHKLCPHCIPPMVKPINDFAKNPQTRTGHASWCKECMRAWANSEEEKARQREIRKQKRRDPVYNQRIRDRQNSWRRKHPEGQRELTMRRKARKKQVTSDKVNYSSILEMYGCHCYLCNQPIDPNAKKRSPESLTFDHVIPLCPRPGEPQGTHCDENLRPAHKVCNSRKGRKPLETLTEWDRKGL